MSLESVESFINLNNLGKYKVSGDEVILGCAFKGCESKSTPKFYINKETEAWHCFRCNKKGSNLKSLAFQLGLVKFSEPTKSSHIYIPITDIENMQRELENNEAALSYLLNVRGFKKSTLKQFKIGFKLVDGNPSIVIPYFDANKACVGMKYDFFKRIQGMEKYRKEKNTKTEFFNLPYINKDSAVIITEGEYDAMSLWQYGYMNVGSLPNGANGIDGWLESISDAPEFILCTDSDSAGYESAQKLGAALGLSKCKQVFPRLKDINEYLQHDLDRSHIDALFNQAVPMFNAPVTSISNYKDSAIELIENPDKFNGFSTGWKSIDNLLGGIRLAETTVLSGETGHGKSSLSFALINNLIKENIKSLIVSPEMTEQDILVDLANGYHRKEVTEAEQIEKFVTEYENKVYIANAFDTWTDKKKKNLLDHVFDIVEYSVRYYGVQFVLLDHMRLFLTPKEQDAERFAIDEFMQKCIHCAIKNNIHILLVVQPKGLPANQKKVTMHDLKGSSNIAQDANNVILIHRNFNTKKADNLVEVDIVKNRKLGTLGTALLEFDIKSKSNFLDLKK